MNVVIEVIAPRLLGPAVVVAVALVVKGYTGVGDGFAAGVVVSLAVALRYIALGADRAERSLPVLRYAPVVAAAGLLLALAVAFAPVAVGEAPLTHLPRPGRPVAEIGTLELTTAAVFDAGLFLLVAGVLTELIHQLARLVEKVTG